MFAGINDTFLASQNKGKLMAEPVDEQRIFSDLRNESCQFLSASQKIQTESSALLC